MEEALVIFDFIASEPEQLTVKAGDIVKVNSTFFLIYL